MNNKTAFFLNTKQLEISKHLMFFLFLILISIIRLNFRFIQQDNYTLYASHFEKGLTELPDYEERLLPGLPITILLISKFLGNLTISSYVSVYLSIFGCIFTIKRIIGKSPNLLFFIFPPIMLAMATQVATEYSSIFLILLNVYFVKNKNYELASVISGINFWFRPIGSLTFLALLGALVVNKERIKHTYLLLFSIPIILLCFYNYYFFGSFSPLYQIQKYIEFSPNGNAIGIVQLFLDIVRTIVKHQYNILLSGLFYLSLFIFFLRKLMILAITKMDITRTFLFASIILMSLYVFSYSFTPFLENMGRYLMPIYAIFWIMFAEGLKTKKWIAFVATLLSVIVTLI